MSSQLFIILFLYSGRSVEDKFSISFTNRDSACQERDTFSRIQTPVLFARYLASIISALKTTRTAPARV